MENNYKDMYYQLFNKITDIIEETMNQTKFIADPTLDQILETEKEAYDFIGGRW